VIGQHRIPLTSLNAALTWIDAAARRLESEDVPLREAAGRVLSEDIRAEGPIPAIDTAAVDGFAASARQTLGASTYNPLSLPLIGVAAGDALPPGTDAVVPLEHGEPDEAGQVVVVEPFTAGDNVDYPGTIAAVGELLVSAGMLLGPHHIGICATARLTRLSVIRRPRVRILVAGTPQSGASDSNGPMLCGLVERDSGIVLQYIEVDRSRSTLANALGAEESDIVLVVGGTGRGLQDEAAAALAVAGELVIHGVALRPGETMGLGRIGSTAPVMLLPGPPTACLWTTSFSPGARSGCLAAVTLDCLFARAR